MHLFWENLLPNLIELWTGEFKGLDEGCEQYRLDRSVWAAIGRATAGSGSFIPSSYGPRLPNIESDRTYYTADMYSFWTQYLGPVLLRRQFKREKYYVHFLKLVELLSICLQFVLSAEDISRVREGFAEWVTDYER